MTKALLRRITASLMGAALLAAGAVGIAAPAQAAVPNGYYKPAYTNDIFQVSDGNARPITGAEWAAAGYPAPQGTPTDYVKYPWSPTVYAVTFWGDAESQWLWDRITEPEWAAAGYPAPRTAGYIAGSYFYKWGTANELFVLGEDGVHHKLTGAEWAASGYRGFDDRANEGFLRLSWADPIARSSDLAAGAGYPIGYGEWSNEAFPTPRTVQRVPGDQFYQQCGSPVIYYAGPTMNRAINANEWRAAGSPQPRVDGAPCGPSTPGTPPNPGTSNPGDTKNCGDFRTQAEAQAWFNTYYPLYGDVARLDQDGNGRACESLP